MTIRFALLGAGRIGKVHAKAITANPGARLVAEPTLTPWRSLNSRLEGPAGLQLTLFQEPDET